MENKQIVTNEIKLFNMVIERHKKQFKHHCVMKNMRHLYRLLFKFHNRNRTKMLYMCENIYVLCGQDLANGFFIQFNMLVMGIVSRLFVFIKKQLIKKII